jgi:Toxin co-regulated pilus biosynthesis protein Q
MTVSHASRLALMSALIVAGSSVAQAGFEWRGPLTPPAPPVSARPSAAPVKPASEMDGLEPVITWDGAPTAAPVAPVEMLPAPELATPVSAPISTEAPLEGFGTDLPLAIALQQIAPAGFRVSFAPGVDPGAPVSWKGGKPWADVLADTLAPLHLAANVKDGTLVVVPEHAAERTLLAKASETMPEPQKILPQAEFKASPQVESKPAETAPVDIRRARPAKDEPAKGGPSFLDRLREWSHGVGTTNETTDAWGNVGGTDPTAPAPEPEAKPVKAITAEPVKPVMPEPAKSITAEPAKPVVAEPVKSVMAEPARGATAPQAAPVAAETLPEPANAAPIPLRREIAKVSETEFKPAAKPVIAEPVKTITAEPMKSVITEPTKPVVAEPVKPAAPTAAAWTAPEGAMLRAVLKDWAKAAGVDLYWTIDYDYKIKKPLALSGSFENALGDILAAFATATPQPFGKLHTSADGTRVLVISAYEAPAGKK